MMTTPWHSLGSWQILVILVLLFAKSIQTRTCGPGVDSVGWTEPEGDINLEVGQTLEIFCVLNNSYISTNAYNAGNIRFYNGSNLINPEHVVVLNETTAKLTIQNASSTSSMFYCNLSHDVNNTSYLANNIKRDQEEDSNKVGVCLNMVKIGTKPGEVTNFTIVSYNWEILNVSWTPPYNPVSTTYSIHYQTPKRSGRNLIFKCPNQEEMITKNRCSWSVGTDPVYRSKMEHLIFTIKGVNALGNRTQTFTINNFAHILPNAPKSLKVVNKTVSSITLEWNIGNLHLLEKGWIFKVEYKWNSSSPTSWIPLFFKSKELRMNTDTITVNITNLEYPNTKYHFRVYMKSAVAITDAFWSEPASLDERTKPAPPYFSPKTDIGSFESVDRNSFSRDIYIYWKPLSYINYNGNNFDYNFTVYSNGNYVPIEPQLVTYSYAKYFNLSMSSYLFVITSVNAEGMANVSSQINVPSKQEMVKEPIVYSKVIYQNDIYEVSWMSSISTLTDFTVFWCESKRDRPYQCDGFTDWIHLPSNVTKHNFTIASNSGYQFAVSANSANSSSGMAWVSCTTMHDQLSKMKNIYASKASAYSIDLNWKLECSEKLDSIYGYNITYCESEQCYNSKFLLVYGDMNVVRGTIEGLKPFTDYRIQIAPFLKDGRLGPFSDELRSRTAEGAPDVQDVKINIVNITSRAADIYWTPPSIANGIIRYYLVLYNEKKHNVTTLINWIRLENLQSYTTYNVSVKVCTTVCSRTKPVSFQTDIGIPGIVNRPLSPSINSSYALITWDKPSEPAGPKPIYDIRLQYHENGKNHTEVQYEVSVTRAQVPIPRCEADDALGIYTIYVRAKNVFMKDNKIIEYIGDWSQAYSFDCKRADFTLFWKMLFLSCTCIIVFAIPFIWKKKICKFYKKKNTNIILPPNFIDILPEESKMNKIITYRIGGPWNNKDECDSLNNATENVEKPFLDNSTTTLISPKVNSASVIPEENFNNSEEKLIKTKKFITSNDSLHNLKINFNKCETAQESKNPEVKLIIGLSQTQKSELILGNTKDGYLKL